MCLFKVNSRNTRTRCEICSKLIIQTPKRHQLNSLRCLYCKLFTNFTTCLVFLIADLEHSNCLLRSCHPFVKICERYIEKQPCELIPERKCSADSKKVVYLCLCEKPAKELFGSKAGGQIMQFDKILNVSDIFIYFFYFFKSMYSYHQMMATFMEIETKAANAWCSKKYKVFLDFRYIS